MQALFPLSDVTAMGSHAMTLEILSSELLPKASSHTQFRSVDTFHLRCDFLFRLRFFKDCLPPLGTVKKGQLVLIYHEKLRYQHAYFLPKSNSAP